MDSIAIEIPRPAAMGGAGYGAGLAFLAAIFFMWGFITVLNDVLIPHLKSVFKLSYTQTLVIQFVFFSTYFMVALPGAKLIEWVGYKYSIAIGGSGSLIKAIVGGAIVPMIQAVVADHYGIRVAFLIPAACYLYVMYFAWQCRRPASLPT